MKNAIKIAAVVCLVALFARSDTVVVTVTADGADAYSAPIRASGTLDRIEIYRTPDVNSDVVSLVLATYEGTTALNTYATVAALATNGTAVIRPRVIGTTTAGVNLAAVDNNGTNTTQMLVAPYERMVIGGNTRMKIGASAGTNAVVKATLFFVRDPR